MVQVGLDFCGDWRRAVKRKSKPVEGGENARWPIAKAKAHLSEITRRAHEEGPQILTSHGKDVAIVEAIKRSPPVSVMEEAAQYRHEAAGEPKDVSPKRPARFWSEKSRGIGDDLVLPERVKVTHRDIDLG